MRRDWRSLVWPIYLYGVRPLLHGFHLLRRPQSDDNPLREPDYLI